MHILAKDVSCRQADRLASRQAGTQAYINILGGKEKEKCNNIYIGIYVK